MRAFVAAAVVVVALLLGGCGAKPADGGFVGGDGRVTTFAPSERKALSGLSGPLLGGGTLDVASLAGKPVVINVWGSWCAPCRKEAPALVKAAKTLGPRAHFVGINSRDIDQGAANAFVRAFGIEYPNFYDPQGTLVLKTGAVTATAIPTTLVLDKSGKVAAVQLGETTEATVVGLVSDLDKEA